MKIYDYAIEVLEDAKKAALGEVEKAYYETMTASEQQIINFNILNDRLAQIMNAIKLLKDNNNP